MREPITNYSTIDQGSTQNEFILRHKSHSNLNWTIRCIKEESDDTPRWEGLPPIMGMAIDHMKIHE